MFSTWTTPKMIGNHCTISHGGGVVLCEISGVVFGWSNCMRVRTMKRVVLPTLTICVYELQSPCPSRYAIPTEESVCGRPTNTHLVLNRVVRCLGYVRNVGRLGCLHLCLVVGWFVADTYITDTRYLMYNIFIAYIPHLRYVHGMSYVRPIHCTHSMH